MLPAFIAAICFRNQLALTAQLSDERLVFRAFFERGGLPAGVRRRRESGAFMVPLEYVSISKEFYIEDRSAITRVPRKKRDGSISPEDLIGTRTFGEKWQYSPRTAHSP